MDARQEMTRQLRYARRRLALETDLETAEAFGVGWLVYQIKQELADLDRQYGDGETR